MNGGIRLVSLRERRRAAGGGGVAMPVARPTLPPLRRLGDFERGTRGPIFQLPEGSVDLSSPPVGLEKDFSDLSGLRAIRRAKAHASRNRGKLLRAQEGGNGSKGYLIPQSARLRGYKARARRFEESRRIKQEKREKYGK